MSSEKIAAWWNLRASQIKATILSMMVTIKCFPLNFNTIKNKWLFKTKNNVDEWITVYKTCRS